MRKSISILVVILGVVGVWYAIWSSLMAGDVARVKSSMAHHYQAIKAVQPHVTLKADDVHATGFPFGFRVMVVRPTLTQVFNNQTYAISAPYIELQNVSDAEGRYRVSAPATFDALYAEENKAPEKYSITVNEMPAMLLRAQGNSQQCSPMPGAGRCAAVADDAPLISFAAQLPARLVLDASLNGTTKQIGFTMIPVSVPIFMTIPAQMDRPLQLFVGMLREALVYNTQTP